LEDRKEKEQEEQGSKTSGKPGSIEGRALSCRIKDTLDMDVDDKSDILPRKFVRSVITVQHLTNVKTWIVGKV
jgi:hypothetical protein